MLIGFILTVFTVSFLLAAIAATIASAVWEGRKQAAGSVDADQFHDSPGILKTNELSSITVWRNLLNRFDFVERMRLRIADSELSWSVGRLTALMLLIGSFCAMMLTELTAIP